MLGEDIVGDEQAIGRQPPVGDDPAAFAKQRRRDAGEADRGGALQIADDEADGDAVWRVLDRKSVV